MRREVDITITLMNIYPGIGLNNIRFGITEAELIAFIGEPNKNCDDTETERRQLQYNQLRSTFWFDDTNLHWIECSHPKLKLNGQQLYEKPIDDAIAFITTALGESPELEDYDSFECHSFEENWLTVRVEYGIVSEIEFGYLFNENDEPILPK